MARPKTEPTKSKKLIKSTPAPEMDGDEIDASSPEMAAHDDDGAETSREVEEFEPDAPEVHVEEPMTTAARVYHGSQVLDHDLYKLKVARMTKNVSFREDSPEFQKFEHCHMFHSIDSSGRAQDTSSAVGGHFHFVNRIPVPGGVPKLEISEPMRWVRRKIKGKLKRVAEPVTLDKEGTRDIHRHNVEYLGSEKIQLRKTNIEFAKVETAVRMKQDVQVPGVVAG